VNQTKRFFILILTVFAVHGEDKRLTPDEALAKLMEGNDRFVHAKLLHPDESPLRREETVLQQNPFAVVLGCSDSRTPPTTLFDQGIGDIFSVRVAGNVVGPIEMESIIYSAIYTGASIFVVLGHENCGAVTATLQKHTRYIPLIAAMIKQNLDGYINIEGLSLEGAIKKNALAVVSTIKQNKEINNYILSGRLKVVAAYYHLGSGEVEILEEEREES
jgi:carbonic anhydrase